MFIAIIYMTNPNELDKIPPRDRLVITEEMIQAGVDEFNRHVADDTPLTEAKEEIVRKVYLSMDQYRA